MPDPYNLVQAPTGVAPLPPQATTATPEELRSRYEWAQALAKNQFPVVRSPWQGVSNMVASLMGGMESYGTDQASRGRAAAGATAYSPFGGTSGTYIGDNAPSAAPSGGALNFASTGGNGLDKAMLEAMKATTKEQESGGNYRNVTTTISKRTGKPQHALGAYGVMEDELPEWTIPVFGRAISREEFLNNPAIQDKMYETRMADYYKKFGLTGAGRAWLGGAGGVNNPERRDPLGTPVGRYGDTFAAGVTRRLGSAGAGGGGLGTNPALALNETPQQPGTEAGDVGARSFVNQFNGGGGPPPTQVAQANGPPGGGQWDPKPTVPPGMVPTRPIYSPQQLQMQLYLAQTPAERVALVNNFMQQFQPIQVPVSGGVVWVNRLNPMQQKYVPTLEKVESTTGPIKEPTPYTVGPFGGGGQFVPIQQPGVPVATPQPATPPVQPAVPAPNITTVPVRPGAPPGGGSGVLPVPGPQGALPAPTTVGAAQPPPAPVQPPVRLAAATPATMTDATPVGAGAVPPMGALAAATPTITDPRAPLRLPVTPAPVPPPGPQTAQFGPPTGQFTLPGAPPPAAPIQGAIPPVPAGMNPQTWQKYMALKNQEVQQKGLEEGATTGAKNYAQRFNDLNVGAQKSREEILPHLKQALAQLDAPGMYTGFGADAVLNWQKFVSGLASAFPNAGFDKYSGKSLQVFSKDIADAILANMKTALGGLGQVRIAEIQLLQQAMASPNNTIEANRTLLNMAIRAQDRLQGYTEMAQDYASGAAVTNPFSAEHEVVLPATPDGSARAGGNIDVGFDKLATKVAKANPAYTPDEIKDINGVWERDKSAPKQGAQGGYQKPTDAYIKILKQQGEAARPYFEKRFGPGSADQYLKK